MMRVSTSGAVRRFAVLSALCLAAACGDVDEPSGDLEADPEAADDESGDDADDQDATTGADDSNDTAPADDGSSDGGDEPEPEPDPEDTGDEVEQTGLVLTIANAEGLNEVVAFTREADGRLVSLGSFLTGGMGTGGGLGSQSALAIADDLLYVVNPGDDTVSSLRIYDDHLALVDIVSTEGTRPTSLSVGDGRLYVLNADGAGSVMGFSLDEGMMTPIAGAARPLSGHEAPAPAQVGLSPQGDVLVVTERATDQILTYAVEEDGSLGEPVVNPSSGQTPFGFQFAADGSFVVSEAFGGGANPGASASSSYRVADGGGLWTFSASVPNGQTGACWVQIVDDRFAYTTNTASNTLSGYDLAASRELALFPGGGVAYDFGDEHGPIDMTVSTDQRYLYVLNARADEIATFVVEDDGALTELGDAVAIPETAVGLIGY